MDCRSVTALAGLDFMNQWIQCYIVQQVKSLKQQCKHHLDSRDQPRPGLLNTCLKRCDALLWPLGNLPRSEKSGRGLFYLLNRKTALRHTVAETCRAPLRGMLGLGHARIARLTGQQRTENDCPLKFSEDSGFPFSFSLRSGRLSLAPRVLYFSLGGFLCFRSFSFLLIHAVNHQPKGSNHDQNH